MQSGRSRVFFWVKHTGSSCTLFVLQGVGKSCLVLRYVKGQFDASMRITVGAAFVSHRVLLPDGNSIKFEIW